MPRKKSNNFYSNLFAGPTKEQQEKMKKQEQVEIQYMIWFYKNSNADLDTCKAKYASLKKVILGE